MTKAMAERLVAWSENEVSNFDSDMISAMQTDCAAAALILREADEEMMRLSKALELYGEKARMSMAPPELQRTIDDALARAHKMKENGNG